MKTKYHRSPAVSWCIQSLRFYKGRHLIFGLTAALCAAILSAALGTGGSLHAGLLRDLRLRLGEVRSGVVRARGLFPLSLAERISDSEASLMLRGQVLDSEGVVCADRANIFGVVENAADGGKPEGNVSVNTRAVEILSALDKTSWSYRFEKPSRFSVELPLGTGDEDNTGRSFVSGIYSASGGLITPDFDPSAASVLPVNVRVPYGKLAAEAGVPGAANILLSRLSPEALKSAIKETLCASDIGLQVTSLEGDLSMIKSSEVFLPDSFTHALQKSGKACRWSVFHLVDDFAVEGTTNTTPYGFTAALTPDGELIPEDMGSNEIIINRWLAESLAINVGDTIQLGWRRFELGGKLVPDKRTFKVLKIIGMDAAAGLKNLMPELPGLKGVDSCSDWDIGMPMDEKKLEDKGNEDYWKQFREAPKAVITYEAGVECFGDAFGEAMSVVVAADAREIDAVIRGLDPTEIGFDVRDLWSEGLIAARGSTDFRGLFTGMMFILMVSALMLAGLTLSLILDSRVVEPALFSALGLKRRGVAWMMFAEWGSASVLGAVAGSFCGTALSRMLVWTLSRFWRDAFAGAQIQFTFSLSSVLLSILFTSVVLCFILAVKVYRCCGVAPVEILKQRGNLRVFKLSPFAVLAERIGGPLCAVGAILIMWGTSGTRQVNAAFFGAGFLLMISLLLFFRGLAMLLIERFSSGRAVVSSAFRAGLIRALESGGRGRTLVILLAIGFFLTVGMLAMKHDPAADSESSSSGSGGFAAIVRSTSSYTFDSGVELARRTSRAKSVVPVRVKAGDEAGCMNMNIPGLPQLYGMTVDRMASLRAFEPELSGGVWSALYEQPEEGVIPALAADQAMLQYSLKMKAGVHDGDEISYRGNDGKEWRIRIVGVLPVRVSILQGALLLNEEHFVKMFPGEGYRMWLTDYAPYELRADNSPKARFPEPGVQVETTDSRLRTLGKMESSYLDMFLVLGGLGLALGVLGVSLVIARSIEERRFEFAVLQAVGIAKKNGCFAVL